MEVEGVPSKDPIIMARSGKDRDTRVRTAKKRTASSTRWLQRQLNDPYVKQA